MKTTDQHPLIPKHTSVTTMLAKIGRELRAAGYTDYLQLHTRSQETARSLQFLIGRLAEERAKIKSLSEIMEGATRAAAA